MDIRNNFLFIDSNNCDQINGQLYGWYVAPYNTRGGGVLVSKRELIYETYDGCYVIVQNFQSEVTICQDSIGSHGLYLYEADGYFAVSNSFLLLIEKLSKFHRKFTLNRDYIDSFLLNGYTMESAIGTPVFEICELPRNISVRINKTTKTLSLHEKVLNERSVDIDSAEGMEIIDKWCSKWTNIIRNLIKEGADVKVDLSGGFDSRLIFMLMVCAKPEWNKVNIQSYQSKVHTFAEDYEIAKAIAKFYGARLNQCEKDWERMPITAHDSLLWSFYIRLGFHKQLQFQRNRYKKPVYHFAGVGGETIRKYQSATKEEYIRKYADKQLNLGLGYDFMPGFSNTLNKSEEAILRIHKNYASEELGTLLWNEGGDRHHHGKEMIEAFGSNELRIGPILDVELQKIRYSAKYPYLLNAVLLMRFAPELLEFKFDSNRIIPEDTLKEAKRINEMFPKRADLNIEEYKFVMGELPLTVGIQEETQDKLSDAVKSAYESGFIKGNMCKLYPARVYEHAKAYYEEHELYPMEEMDAAIAVAYSVHYAELSYSNEGEDSLDLLEEKRLVYGGDVEDDMSRWRAPEHRLYANCRIILYGAGNMGQAFYKQIKKRGLGKIVLWVDKEPYGKGEEVRPLSELAQVHDYDILLIAIENREIQKEVMNTLRTINFSVFDEDKIIFG